MKAALYIRVSTDAQDVNRQVSDLTARAISDGNEIINVFQDKISGFKNELQREGLAELLNLTSDDVQLIYISELSRLSRNPTYLKVLVDQFTNKGINLFFLSQNINTLNKDGKTEFTTALLISILSEYSSYEITLKNQRSKSGKKEAIVNKGNAYSYKPAYGYKNVDKKLLIEHTEAAIISEIFQRYADGKSVREIVQWLNLTGAPTRNTSFMKKESYRVNGSKTISKDEIKWGKSSVRNIIRNTVYCGFRIIKGDYKIITPAIITEDLFYKCQSEIKDRVTHTDKTLKNDFMLRGILRCGECGKYFIGTRSHGNLLYKCADKTHTKSNSYIGCNNGSIFQIHVEPMIWNTIKFSYVMMKNSQLMKENIVEINVKIENLTGELNALGGAIAELNNESSRLVSLYVKGLFEESALDKEQRRIKADLDTLNRRQAVCHELRNSASMSLKSIEDLSLSKLNIQAVDESPILQKEAVKELISEVLMHKIDNLFTVFEIIYKAGYSNFIIRQTWTKKYMIADGKMFNFDKTAHVFHFSGDDKATLYTDTLFADLQRNQDEQQ